MTDNISDLTILVAVCGLALWPIVLFVTRMIQERNRYRERIDRMTKDVLDEISTDELVRETLKKIGCQPEDNEYGKISFKYQGELFYIDAEEESRFIMIWDPWWGSVEADNEALPYLKEVINIANTESIVTVVYVTSEDDKTIGLHSHCHTFFSPNEGDLSGHLKAVLDQFFEAQKFVKENMNQISLAAAQQQEKERVKIKGFSAYKENTMQL